ncbi:MAG: MATE family efflux transporter [Bacteroidaceae bacterium]|nr:MATE family efflux transporter [Bacteroidaceae bacterium]
MRPISSHIKAISLLGLPIVVGQLGVIVQGMADTIMVGQYGTLELSASALVNNIYNFIIFFLLGISYATTPITGAAFGQGDDESVSRSLKDSLIVNLSFSAIIVFLLTVLYFNLDILRQPEKLMPLVRPYYLTIMLSLPFLAGFNALKQFVEAVGETNIPMRVMLVSNAINIALNAILIYGMMGLPEWGLFGAGLATFIARVFLFVTMLVVVFRGRRFKVWTGKVKGENGKLKTDSSASHLSNCSTERGATRSEATEGVDNPLTSHRSSLSGSFRMARIGLPIAVQLCLESASFNIAGMFMGWIGAIPLAAHQVICTISTLVFMIQYGIGAAAIRVSQFRGRGEWTEVRHATYSAWGLSATFSLLMVGCICLFREPITSIFTSDLRVQTLCYSLLPAFVLYQFGDCTQIIFSNSLRALEAVGRMLLYAIIAYLLVCIPMSYLLGIHLGFGAEGVWYGIPFGLTTAGLLFIYEFRRKTKHLT